MRLMAIAGYHPDCVFALHHLLRIQTGEQSKFAAFFQDHPRWETRDQRSEQAYSEALQQFNTLWPNPLFSPGGEPVLVAFAGHPQAKENKTEGTVDLHLPLYCRNARDPLSLVIHLNKDKHELQTDNPAYRNTSYEKLNWGPFHKEVRKVAFCGFWDLLKRPWAYQQRFKRGFWGGITGSTGVFGLQPGKRGSPKILMIDTETIIHSISSSNLRSAIIHFSTYQ
jgi:hypothetical protein